MFIKDLYDEMINISDFESITIEYVSYGGNNAHHIVGKYTIHRDKTSQMLSGYEKTLGIFLFRKQAEMAYENLMKTVAAGSGLFEMPKGEELNKSLDAETVKELQAYESEWLKKSGEKPVKQGCGCSIVILLSAAAAILFFL